MNVPSCSPRNNNEPINHILHCGIVGSLWLLVFMPFGVTLMLSRLVRKFLWGWLGSFWVKKRKYEEWFCFVCFQEFHNSRIVRPSRGWSSSFERHIVHSSFMCSRGCLELDSFSFFSFIDCIRSNSLFCFLSRFLATLVYSWRTRDALPSSLFPPFWLARVGIYSLFVYIYIRIEKTIPVDWKHNL